MHAANTGAVFDNQANNIAVTRAALEARVDGAKFLNNISSILSTQGPAYLPQAEQDVDAFVGTLSRVPPEKRAAMAADLKNNLNVAAAMMLARNNPEAAIKAIDGGQFNLDPTQRQQVLSHAKEAQNAARVQEAFLRSEAERQKQEKSDQAVDGYFKQIMTGGFSMKAALNDETLTPRAREHIVLLADRKRKENAGEGKASDPKTLNELYMRITAPEGTPGKIYNTDLIYEATKAGKLSIQHDAYLRNLVGGQPDANNQKIQGRLRSMVSDFGRGISANLEIQAMAQADKGLPMELQNTFRARVEDKMQELRQINEPPSQVFDPKSKHFVGSREFTQSVLQEVMGQKRDSALPTVNSQEEYDALPAGATYRDSNGNPATKTKGAANAKTAKPSTDYNTWLAATGGRLKPGQTQEQAIAEWKGGK